MVEEEATKDVEAMARAAAGDRAAFERVVQRHAPSIRRLARAMSGDDAAAADIVQDAFLDAFRAAASFDPERASVRTWLFAIAKNAARRARRKRGEIPVEDPEGPLDALGVRAGWGAELPDLAFEREEDVARLARAMASLPGPDREILILRDVEGISGEAAAELLGVALAAMKSRLHRARLRLLAALRASEGGVVANEREVGGMRCGEVLAVLGDVVDGDLAARESARVTEHLRGCTVCERFGGRYGDMVHAVRERLGAPPAVDPAEVARIVDALRAS